jgi:hypothetical protein
MVKVLLFDIENRPLLSYVWEVYEADSIKVVEQRDILSFAYKWVGDKNVKVFSLRNNTHKQLLRKLHSLLNEADVVVGHNSKSFDTKMVNSFFVHYGFKPPSPYKQIDTLSIAKNKFRFASNHLNDLGEYLGCGKKVETGGFKLWEGCMKGEKKSWLLMEKYNKGDVELLEKVYNKLVPWAENTPYMHEGLSCPKCGGNVQFRGAYINRTQIGKRYQCIKCGSWGISNRHLKINSEYIK